MRVIWGLLSPAERGTTKPFSDKLVSLMSKQFAHLATVLVLTAVYWNLLRTISGPSNQMGGTFLPHPYPAVLPSPHARRRTEWHPFGRQGSRPPPVPGVTRG